METHTIERDGCIEHSWFLEDLQQAVVIIERDGQVFAVIEDFSDC